MEQKKINGFKNILTVTILKKKNLRWFYHWDKRTCYSTCLLFYFHIFKPMSFFLLLTYKKKNISYNQIFYTVRYNLILILENLILTHLILGQVILTHLALRLLLSETPNAVLENISWRVNVLSNCRNDFPRQKREVPFHATHRIIIPKRLFVMLKKFNHHYNAPITLFWHTSFQGKTKCSRKRDMPRVFVIILYYFLNEKFYFFTDKYSYEHLFYKWEHLLFSNF